MKSENQVKKEIELALNQGPTRVYANPSGMAMYGRRRVSYGCGAEAGQKAPDFIGYHSIKITPEMVGKTVAVILWPEAKKEDGKGKHKERELAQQIGCDRITKAGGIAGIVASAEEAVSLITNFEKELKRNVQEYEDTRGEGVGKGARIRRRAVCRCCREGGRSSQRIVLESCICLCHW